MAPPATAAAAVLAATLLVLATGQQHSRITNVKDLEAAMYTKMSFAHGAGDACVRLLTATGTVGCAAPGTAPADGRLLRLTELLPSAEDYPDNTAFLLPSELLAGFLQQCAAAPALAARVRGVLAEPWPASSWSQADAAPLAELALYPQKDYQWNPAGKGLAALDLPFPVFLLDNATAEAAVQRTGYNAEQAGAGALNHARMALRMEAASNSSACIAAKACLPLGGHSVVATLPPLPPPPAGGGPPPSDGLPAVWLLAQVDSSALFHEATAGADAPLSGLIAMLAAAEALGSANASAALAAAGQRYRRRLVFAALVGEPWGLMGSRRMLWELSGGGGGGNASAPLAGLSIADGSVAGVLEVTQVGRSRRGDGRVQLYTHTPAAGGAAAADPQAGLLAALQTAAAATPKTAVSPASAAAPGLPPTASAGAFVRLGGGGGGKPAGKAVPAVLLSGFDAAFEGATFQTQYDTLDTIDLDAVASTAAVVARAAHELALADAAAAAAAPLPLDAAALRATVGALAECLLNSTVGFNCGLAKAMMTPVSGGKVSHYVSILRTLTADPQTPEARLKRDVERFIWNFFSFSMTPLHVNTSSGTASVGGAGGGDQPLQRCQPMNATGCPPGWACAGSRSTQGSEGMGVCLNVTVRYSPSYSTALRCDACDGAATLGDYGWKPTDAAAEWAARYGWPPDPMWMESNWPQGTPALTLYLREADGTEWALLGTGIGATALALAATLGVQWAHRRKLKRQ